MKKNTHIDPPRFPLLIEPIEKKVLGLHKKHFNQIIIDVTKKLVQLKKK